MEKHLMTGLKIRHRSVSLSPPWQSRPKQKGVFAILKDKAGPVYVVEFGASSGWFKQFKNRNSLHIVKVSCESASADVKEVEEVLETLYKLIVEENYV
jgi:hypothetical protein